MGMIIAISEVVGIPSPTMPAVIIGGWVDPVVGVEIDPADAGTSVVNRMGGNSDDLAVVAKARLVTGPIVWVIAPSVPNDIAPRDDAVIVAKAILILGVVKLI